MRFSDFEKILSPNEGVSGCTYITKMSSSPEWRSTFYPRGVYSDDDCTAERLRRINEFILQRDYPGGTKQYASFSSAKMAYEFIIKQPLRNRNFHETIFKEHKQKPRFDIDIVPIARGGKEPTAEVITHEELLARLLTEIKRVIGPELDLVEDLAVYSSHAKDGSKMSYHVILNGYHVNDNVEAGKFAKFIRDSLMIGIPDAEAEFISKSIDLMIYKKMQHLRLLGCTKLGKERFKEAVYSYQAAGRLRSRKPYEDPYDEFLRSLITNIDPEKSKFLEPQLYTPPEKHPCSKDQMIMEIFRKGFQQRKSSIVIEPEKLWIFNATEIIAHLIDAANHLPIQLGERSLFNYKVIDDRMIMLRAPRDRGYPCVLCSRIHDNENPYLILYPEFQSTAITDDCNFIVVIAYKCRRDPTKSIRLCSMRKSSERACFTCTNKPHDPKRGEIRITTGVD